MTDEAAFLAAIISEPADDTARLAYADWLTENGGTEECSNCNGKGEGNWWKGVGIGKYDTVPCHICSGTGRVDDGRSARAEFIRVQVELARLAECENAFLPGFCSPGEECRYCTLRRREQELFVPAALKWLPLGSPEYNGGWSWDTPNVAVVAWGLDHYFHRGFISALSCSWSAWRAHADQITRTQPIERVRLTDWPPALRHPDDVANFRGACKFRWPKIEFDLPAEREAAMLTAGFATANEIQAARGR